MLKRRLRTIALAGALTLAGALQILPAAATVQSSSDIIRIENNGIARLYQVSIDYAPQIVNLPDGGAWGFFTARLRLPGEPGSDPVLSNHTLFATRFDTSTGTWSPAQALPGTVSFGPAAVADSSGNVHVVYSIRNSPTDETAYSTLVYLTVDSDGNWSDLQVIAASETAGHQINPDLAIDADGGLHLAWQDQRSVSEELRTAEFSNADVFASDLNPDGTWTEPVQINQRPDDKTHASRPQLVADGDRLVAVWSVYNTDIGWDTASSLMWSERSLSDPNSWTEQQQILEHGDDIIGGRFLDLADDPAGGVTFLYGRRTSERNEIYLQRLPQGSDSWSDAVIIASGDGGNFPRIAVGADGTTFVVFNLGSGLSVKVGALAIAPEQTIPGPLESLTAGEEGIQGIASVSVDTLGRPWVIYFSQAPQQTIVNEARALRSVIVSSEPPAEEPAQSSPVAEGTPEAAATPAG